MTNRELSFCFEIVLEESLTLKEDIDSWESEYIDSREIVVTQSSEGKYLDSIEVEFVDGSGLYVNLMNEEEAPVGEEDFNYHIRYRPETATNNFEESDSFLEWLNEIVDGRNLQTHFMTVSVIKEEFEDNLPSEFEIKAPNHQNEFFQVSDGEDKKFGFTRIDEGFEFYVRHNEYDGDDFKSKRDSLWNTLEGWMES